MIREDKEALICDMAETYHIFDIFSYPARFIATLACGLKADSRIKTKMAGVNILPPNSLLYALIVDELRLVRYWLMGDKNNKPQFVTELMENGLPEKELEGFDTVKEFEAKRREIIERLNNGDRNRIY
jgi:hypothetical protein